MGSTLEEDVQVDLPAVRDEGTLHRYRPLRLPRRRLHRRRVSLSRDQCYKTFFAETDG